VFLPVEAADAEETRRAVEACGQRCLLIPGDLTSRGFCEECVRRVLGEFGQLDILVSNAAYQNRVPELGKVTDEEFDKTFKTNIYAYFYLCRAPAKHMQPGSAIIATSSETGLEGAAKFVAYSSTKRALNAVHNPLERLHVHGLLAHERLTSAETPRGTIEGVRGLKEDACRIEKHGEPHAAEHIRRKPRRLAAVLQDARRQRLALECAADCLQF